MGRFFESIYDLNDSAHIIALRRYGVIEVANGKLVAIHFRPWPKLISTTESKWLGGWQHGRGKKDQCLFYYNQPLGHTNFLALKYTLSTFGTTYQTFRRTALVLDEVARIKKTDAIVAEITNSRISDRFMHRMGWELHLHDSPCRNYIKRFYGEHPEELATHLSQEMNCTR